MAPGGAKAPPMQSIGALPKLGPHDAEYLQAAGTLERTAPETLPTKDRSGKTLRSQEWFDNPDNPGMTALYIERYLNFGLTREELQRKTLRGLGMKDKNQHHARATKVVKAGGK